MSTHTSAPCIWETLVSGMGFQHRAPQYGDKGVQVEDIVHLVQMYKTPLDVCFLEPLEV